MISNDSYAKSLTNEISWREAHTPTGCSSGLVPRLIAYFDIANDGIEDTGTKSQFSKGYAWPFSREDPVPDEVLVAHHDTHLSPPIATTAMRSCTTCRLPLPRCIRTRTRARDFAHLGVFRVGAVAALVGRIPDAGVLCGDAVTMRVCQQPRRSAARLMRRRRNALAKLHLCPAGVSEWRSFAAALNRTTR